MDIVDRLNDFADFKDAGRKPEKDDLFRKAASEIQSLRNQLALAKEQLAECQWISVEDKLPELGQWYLIFVKDKFATMAFLDAHTETGETLWLAHNNNFQGEWENVTHWQPLPQPPKAMSEKE